MPMIYHEDCPYRVKDNTRGKHGSLQNLIFDWEFSALCLSSMWPLDASLLYSGSLNNFTHLLNIVLPQGFVRGLSNCGYLFFLIIWILLNWWECSFIVHPPIILPLFSLPSVAFQSWVHCFPYSILPYHLQALSLSFRGSHHWGRKYLNSLSSMRYSIN